MDCPICLTPNTEQARYCSACGNAILEQALEAERRQIAVVFCDLAGSTELAARFDPEDFSAIIRRYHERCAEIIRDLSGHVAQCLGDGVLAYFGYPRSHENDALLAVRAGLRLVSAVRHLNAELRVGYGIELSIRVGIHAGVVVMAEVGIGPRPERLALGSVPNLAARIQGVAARDTVLISEEVNRLAAGYLHTTALAGVKLRGFESPTNLYEVTGEASVQSRFDVASASAGGLTPFVGDPEEVNRLLNAWRAVEGGRSHALLLEGDAGIGKSRRIHMLKEAIASAPHMLLELQCTPETTQSAFYPVSFALRERLLAQPGDAQAPLLARLERALGDAGFDAAEAVPLLAPLLSVPLEGSGYAPTAVSSFKAREDTLNILLGLLTPTLGAPSLLIFEDVHWADASTLDLVQRVLNSPAKSPRLVIITRRSDFELSLSPATELETLVVRKLSRAEARRIADHVAGGSSLPSGSLDALLERSDGVPLFIEELTKTVVETGVLAQEPLPTGSEADAVDGIPTSVRGLLGSRLDRMGGAKAVMQLGAVLGREFRQDVLEAVSPLVGLRVRDHLRELLRAGMLFANESGNLSFRHALIRDAAYATLLKATRRQYHERTADVLLEKFPQIVAAQPELVAQHYDRAARADRAFTYWTAASQRALATNAHREAAGHAGAGISALGLLNGSVEHRRAELELRALLGMALVATQGYASTSAEENFTQAETVIRDLSQSTGPSSASEQEKQFVTTWCVWAYRLVRSELASSHISADHLHALAGLIGSSDLRMRAHCSLGITLFYLADPRALPELEAALAAYDDEKHRGLAARLGEDPKTVCLSYVVWIEALSGNPARARARLAEALAHAERHGHRFSEAYLAAHAAALFYLLRDEQACEKQAERAIAISERYGFPAWLGVGGMHRGWTKVRGQDARAGLEEIRANNGMLDAISILLYGPTRAEALSQALEANGELEAALELTSSALARAVQAGERWYQPELERRKAVLELRLGLPREQVEQGLQSALELARRQGSRLLELRAATTLAQFLGDRERTSELLEPVLSTFASDCEEVDVVEARQLLAG